MNMKKCLAGLVAGGLITASVPFSVFGADVIKEMDTVKYVSSSAGANVRSDADADSSLLAHFDCGDSIYVTGYCSNDWYRVCVYSSKYGCDVEGYVSAGLLSGSSSGSSSSSSGSSSSSSSSSIRSLDKYMYVSNGSSGANVRSQPWSDSSKLTHLDTGDEVYVTGKTDDGWYRVSVYIPSWGDYGTGYIAEGLLSSSDPGYSGSSSSSSSGSSSDYTTTSVDKDLWVSNGGSGANLRTSPSTSSSVIALLPSGTQMYAYGKTSNGWYKVSVYVDSLGYYCDGYVSEGIVSSSYVSGSSSSSSSSSGSSGSSGYSVSSMDATYYVSNGKNGANLRKTPSTSGSVIDWLPTGTDVYVSGKTSNGWYQVSATTENYDFVSGYIAEGLLSSTKPSTTYTSSSSGSSSSSSAVTAMDAYYYVSNGSNGANFRVSPSSSSNIITWYSTGTEVHVIGKTSGWYKVNGYVAADGCYYDGYIAEGLLSTKNPGSSSSSSSASGSSSSSSSGYSVTTMDAYYYVSNGSTAVNVRTTPYTSGGAIMQLHTGDQVHVIGRTSNGWYRVSVYDSSSDAYVTAYISEGLLSSKNPIASDSSSSSSSDSSVTQMDAYYYASNGSTAVNIRSSASTSGTVVTQIHTGDQVHVLGRTSNGWYKVSVYDAASGNYCSGYVAEGLVSSKNPIASDSSSSSSDSSSSGTTTKVMDAYYYASNGSTAVNVRSSASTSSTIVTQIYTGDQAHVLGKTSNGWYKVSVYDASTGTYCSGYIAEGLLSSSNPIASDASSGSSSSSGVSPSAATDDSDAEAFLDMGSYYTVNITSGYLRLRDLPGNLSSSQVIAGLGAGTVVRVDGLPSANWVPVTVMTLKGESTASAYTGMEGYLHYSYLK